MNINSLCGKIQTQVSMCYETEKKSKMININTTPLGYVELDNGQKAIYPMNDIFLNYTFEKTANWESLRLTVNLIIEAYRQLKPDTKLKPVTGKIQVRTQFKHMLSTDGKTTRDQDIKLTEKYPSKYRCKTDS